MVRCFSTDDFEALSLAKIPVDLRKEEPELYLTKWFDYRCVHPAQTTLVFVRLYESAVRTAYSQYKDRDKALKIKFCRTRTRSTQETLLPSPLADRLTIASVAGTTSACAGR
jgi:hypothetical protein